jgi:hypothetical protein
MKGWRAKFRLRLELPKRPKTIGELRFVRYWLRQLARAHVVSGEFRDIPLCPAFIHALFASSVNKNEEESDFLLSFDTLKARNSLHFIKEFYILGN